MSALLALANPHRIKATHRRRRNACSSHFGHGRRVQITKTSDSKINYPLYSLDGKLLVEDNRQTLQRIEYIFAGGRLVAKKIQPITATGANNGAATITTIHTDFLGSPVAETNASGAVDKVERFTPYGEAADLALDAGPGFTGHATDVLTGLTYMQQRYYDAEIGRFISPDPVTTDPNTGANFNVYWYANNNPIANIDPDGTTCTGSRILNDSGSCASNGQSTVETQAKENKNGNPRGGNSKQPVPRSRNNESLTNVDQETSDLGVMEGYISDPKERLRQNAIDNTKPIESVCLACIAIPILRAEKLFGPASGLFGKANYRAPGNAGILNSGKVRIGWSYNKKDGRLHFSLRIGKWHSDKYFDPISIVPPPIK